VEAKGENALSLLIKTNPPPNPPEGGKNRHKIKLKEYIHMIYIYTKVIR